jgi:indolepyruvate ferredoxin oxidoreductase alpha subunit
MSENQELVMTGNEAIAHGARIAGVSVATGYPGGPSTSVLEHLAAITSPGTTSVEWSGNEKVALEVAYGASIAGERSLVSKKMAGLNVALDSLMVVNLLGISGGMLVAVGDVPGAMLSGNEQDSRVLGAFAELPVLEPSCPEEGMRMVQHAFEISEEFGIPVVLRYTKSYAVSKQIVRLPYEGRHRVSSGRPGRITKCFVPGSERVRAHRELHSKNVDLSRRFCLSPFNMIEGKGDIRILTSGHIALTVQDTVKQSDADPRIKLLRLGTVHPLPEDLVLQFSQESNEILVIEEIEPFIEDRAREILHRHGIHTKILGKRTGNVPWGGEMKEHHVRESLHGFLGDRGFLTDTSSAHDDVSTNKGMCEGCPYATCFSILKQVIGDRGLPRPVFVGEPSCAVYLRTPSYDMLDVKVSLGSSVAVGTGIAKSSIDRNVIAIVGDSAFYHSEINGIINAACLEADILILLIYNHTAGITGRQPHPGTGYNLRGESAPLIEPEPLVRACGVKDVKIVNGTDKDGLRLAFEDALGKSGPRVVIYDEPCPLVK